MARITIMTSGLTGILNASFALADRLQKAGHDVHLAAPRAVDEQVTQQGWPFYRLPVIDAFFSLPAARGNKIIRIARRWRKRKHHQRAADQYYGNTDLAGMLDATSPDLLLIDVELHAHIFAAHARGLPYLLLSQWYTLLDFPGLPYLMADTIPGRGWKGSSWGIRLHWWRVKLSRFYTFSRSKLLSFGLDRRSSLLRIADQHHFPRKYIRKNFWPGPVSYADLPILSMAPREMEFPYQKPDWQHYIGPMVHAGRKEKLAKSLNGYSVEAILAQKNQENKKLIVCTVSTMRAGDSSFLQKIATAVADHPNWLLVIGVGQEMKEFVNAPNVFPFSFLPQLTLLAQADLSINHGGIHTIHECIHFGVPMVVYHGKKSDQPGCAARVQYHGLGLMADKDLDTVALVRQKIERVLSDQSFSSSVEDMRNKCLAYPERRLLEQIIQNKLTEVDNTLLLR